MCYRRGPSHRVVVLLVLLLVTVWVIVSVTLDKGGTAHVQRETSKLVATSGEINRPTRQADIVPKNDATQPEDTMSKAALPGYPKYSTANASIRGARWPADTGWSVQLPENFTVHKGFEANPHNYSYILNAETLCNDFDHRRLRVLVFVESHVRNTERRAAIRRSWAQRVLQKALNFRVVFLLADDGNSSAQQAVIKEHYTYGDISQESFVERFENLSIKSIMGLKYSVTFCRSADHIIKIDDDIFLHMPNAIKSFERYRRTPLKNQLLCHRNRVMRILRPGQSPAVLRTKATKYEVSHDLMPGNNFPPYCSGFSYSMSASAALKLYNASLGTPLFFIEDVYVTGFCRHKAGVKLFDHPGMALRPLVTEHNAPCYFHFTDRITSNEVSPKEMLDIWDAVNTVGYFCPR